MNLKIQIKMTFKQFKISAFLFLLTSIAFAQKYDKKFNEKFKTNKDVVVAINASNATIDVTTWNKNEVSVEAVIEVEGLDKKAAEKYLKNWEFEALGNKKKVQINTGSSNSHSFGNDNIVFFNSSKNNHPNVYQYSTEGNQVIVIPEMPEIEMPEIPELPEIVIPEINFEEILNRDFSNIEKMFENGDLLKFKWKEGPHNITVKSLKEWREFKKTDSYKDYLKNTKSAKKKLFFKNNKEKGVDKEKLKKELERVKKELRKIDKSKIKKELARARAEVKRINKREIQRELLNAKKQIELTRKQISKTHYNYSFNTNNNDFTVNGKKVKVTKKIIIKVPKNATFDLNTRHCKIKLPKTKASGKISYGTFKADVLNGGKLNVSYSPLIINSLNACTLFLNNVTDAHIASVTNTTLNSNSSGLTVGTIYKNVEVSNKFGELKINKIDTNYSALNILLNYSNAIINTSGVTSDLIINIDKKSPLYPNKASLKFNVLKPNMKDINGDFIIKTKDKTFVVEGKYSQISIKE